MSKLLFLTSIVLLFSCKTEKETQLVGWGDSMMKGAGGKKSILEVISNELDQLEYTNYGVGGLKSHSVATLQGGLPLKLKFDKENLKLLGSATSVYYSNEPFNDQTKQYRSGSIGVHKGSLIRNSSPENSKQITSFTFKKGMSFNSLQLQDTVVFKFDDAQLKEKAITIIWAGRNDEKSKEDTYQTRDNIQAMMDHLDADSKKRLLILSICNGIGDEEFAGSKPHTQIGQLNGLLQDAFGEYFIDIRTYMVEKAIYDMGMPPTTIDLEDIAKDCIPRSFFYDNVHFNTKGYEAVGKYLAQVIKDKGWIN